MAQAAAAVETQLQAAPGVSPPWRSLLELNADQIAAPASAVLAAYCTAAGEAARLERPSASLLARQFLTSALAFDEKALNPALAAQAAYRLSLTPPTQTGERSARGGGSADIGLDLQLVSALVADTAPCSRLSGNGATGGGFEDLEPLACAAKSATASGDWRLVGIADLKLARRLTGSATPPADLNLKGASRGGLQDSGGPKSKPSSDKAEIARLAHEAARKALREGVAAVLKLPPSEDRSQLLGRLAETGLSLDGPDVETSSAIHAMDAGGLDTAAYQAALTGVVAFSKSERATGKSELEHALFLEGQSPSPLRLPDWYMMLTAGDKSGRSVDVANAYQALQAVRPLLPANDPYSQDSIFSWRIKPVFEAALDVELSGDRDDLKKIAAAQDILEAYRDAEIQNAFGDDCIPPLPQLKPNDLRPGEIILYPILLSDRVELIYAIGGESAYHRLPPNTNANRAVVSALIERLRLSLTTLGDDWRPASRALYDILIAPIESRLTPTSNLAIVPDGELRALPFAALTDPSGRVLIERTRLSIAPALSYSKPGADRAGRHAIVLAAALEKPVTLPSGRFPKLDGTGAEARVAAGFGVAGAHGAVIDNFTRASLTLALKRGRTDILHLATHASFNGRSDQSFIVADGEAIPLSDLRHLLSENLVRQGGIDLLVLSACDTASGDDQASMGLAGAAIQSGARSALASVWQVDDASTAQLMQDFYAAYRGGESKSGALRSAQLALSRDPEFANPYYWAAFTMIGGWR